MPKDWVIRPPAPQRDALASALRISPVVAQVLCNRGITDAAAARAFLNPRVSQLAPPEAFPAAVDAARHIVRALRAGRKIVLFGDYDVDGITGVSILWHCLSLAGGRPNFYIPHRLEEGYGISTDAIDALADDGAELIISVDCGITALEPAARARARGVELIITDHHAPHVEDARPRLPDARIVHPAVAADGAKPYAFPHLSGAGVAFKLAWAIAQEVTGAGKVRDDFRDLLVEALALAALGTIADIVPLTGENRIIARNGLLGLRASRLPGLQALIEVAGLTNQNLDAYDIGFKLAPRLNAIGRMGNARLAVEMLTRADADEAIRIARNLDRQNRARQALERRITTEARRMVLEQNQNTDHVRAIVLASENWHAGVIGIVASRITSEFGRPTVLIAIENGVGQGSARSIRNFHLCETLGDCAEHLLNFGGHAMAAGLRIRRERIEAFRLAFQERAGRLLTPADLRPRLDIDDVVPLSALAPQLVSDLSRLEPFGAGNPGAAFATDWLQVVGEPRAVGSDGTHLQVVLGDGRLTIRAIAFGQAALRPTLLDHRRCRVAFEPIINEWNGRTSVEMQVRDFQFPS